MCPKDHGETGSTFHPGLDTESPLVCGWTTSTWGACSLQQYGNPAVKPLITATTVSQNKTIYSRSCANNLESKKKKDGSSKAPDERNMAELLSGCKSVVLKWRTWAVFWRGVPLSCKFSRAGCKQHQLLSEGERIEVLFCLSELGSQTCFCMGYMSACIVPNIKTLGIIVQMVS